MDIDIELNFYDPLNELPADGDEVAVITSDYELLFLTYKDHKWGDEISYSTEEILLWCNASFMDRIKEEISESHKSYKTSGKIKTDKKIDYLADRISHG